jgi:hypothetical protein
MTLIHSISCIKETAEHREFIRAWEQWWPNYCRKCGAVGGFHNPGVYRYPDGSGEPPSFDECECIDEGRCPRCGMDWKIPLDISEELAPDVDTIWLDTFLFEKSYPCPCCGWNWGNGDYDCHPPEVSDLAPCDCEVEYEDRLQKEYWKMMEEESIRSEDGSIV